MNALYFYPTLANPRPRRFPWRVLLALTFIFGLSTLARAETVLANISTRVRVETGSSVAIGGFVIHGTGPKRLLIRVLGPSLLPFGVSDILVNPSFELFDALGRSLRANDDWRSSQQTEIMGTNLAPGNDREAAMVVSLNDGAYTAIVRGADGGSGVALIEVYDLTAGTPDMLINLSTRGMSRVGQNAMIGGFVIQGPAAKKVLIRAMGPSLVAFGVQGAMADPTLTIYNSSGQAIATNDNWRATQAVEIAATNRAPSDDRESAILLNLPAGSYTAIVRGAAGSEGVALVEVYDMDPTAPPN